MTTDDQLQLILADLHAAEAERNRLEGELSLSRADNAALRDAFNRYMAADDNARPSLHARLIVLHCAEHPGAALLAELEALRAYRAYWEPIIKRLGDAHTRQGGELATAQAERETRG
jgi:hypothetical protein